MPNVVYSMLRARVIAARADDFMRGGGLSVTHLVPTEANVHDRAAFVDRVLSAYRSNDRYFDRADATG